MFKRKIIYYPLIVLVFLAFYLYVANGFIYYRIGQGGLVMPPRQNSYTMGEGKEIKYIALGDSLTSGVGADKYEESYPYLLAQKMTESGLTVTSRNFSEPGYKTYDLINIFLDSAVVSQPDVVTILIGVNDIHNHVSKEEFKKNYEYILGRLTKETKAKINLINIPLIGSDTVLYPPYDYYFNRETNNFNDVIKELAKNHNANYIDLNTPTKNLLKTDGLHYSVDSFHPSALGYKLWAQIIYDRLNY